MILRTVVFAANLAAFAAAFLLQILYPPVAPYIFWAILIWLGASLYIFRLPAMSRPTPRFGVASTPPDAAPPLPSIGVTRPLPSGEPTPLGFCAYCGTVLAVGATSCRTCGRAVRAF